MTLCIAAALMILPAPKETLIVLNKAEASASLIDIATGQTYKKVQVGVGPHEAAVSPDGKTAVVANYGAQQPGRTLSVVRLPSGEVAKTIEMGEHVRPHGVEFIDTSRVAVSSETRGAVAIVNISSGRLEKVLPTQGDVSHMVALSPDKKTAFTTNIRSGSLSIIDVASARVLAVVPTGAGAEGIDVSPDGKTVWVSNGQANTVSVVDVAARRKVGDIQTGQRPLRAKFLPGGKRAIVTCVEGGEIMLVDVATRKTVKTIQTKDLDLDYPAQAPSPLPLGVVAHPNGREAYIACMAARKVLVLDLQRLEITRSFDTGDGPDGMALARHG